MLWLEYLKRKIPQICVFILMSAIYLVTFWLWHLPFLALMNGTLLALVVFVVYLVVSYFRWSRLHLQMLDLQERNRQLLDRVQEQDLESKEFTDIIRVWSHQMKVPLSAIDLMTQTEIDPQELKNQVFSLENYLKILLEYQRITNLATDFRFETFSVDQSAKNLIKKYSRFFIQKGLSVKFEVKEDWQVTTDQRWFELALEQIVNNAVKYTSKGGLTIEIEPGQISIQDTGIGILAEDLPRLFEHGFTGYNGRVQQKSTGLGLYLTKLVLDKLGFSIQVTSKMDEATKVTIYKH